MCQSIDIFDNVVSSHQPYGSLVEEQYAEREFVETICVEQGKALNIERHNVRMNRTREVFWGEAVEHLRLEDYIAPEKYDTQTRCRVVYGKEVLKVEYFPYQLRKVASLRLVTCDEADYTFKSTNRTLLNTLYAQRGAADDVLVVRNGLLTDTSIANIALYDGENWYTPTHPLMKGTQRQLLLDEGKIKERELQVSDLHHYQKICLFNAMIPFGRIEFATSAISD